MFNNNNNKNFYSNHKSYLQYEYIYAYIRKNVVYEITCSHCGILYIGETGRTIGSRIKEHLTMDKQTVYKHLESHKEREYAPNHNDITREILHSNIKFADEIHKKSHNIMNGCIGRTITI
jgi:hypothetical protein